MQIQVRDSQHVEPVLKGVGIPPEKPASIYHIGNLIDISLQHAGK